MPLCPKLYVEAPAVTPYGFGLYSVAQMPVPEQTPHWRCGVQYEPLKCGQSKLWGDPCDNPAQPDKIPDDGVPLMEGDPFLVWDGYHCRLPGRSSETEIRRRAIQALSLGEQRAVEEAFWTGSMGNDPHLADPSTTVLNPVNPPTAADALAPVAGLAALEEWLGHTYAGTGIIHAPRGVSALFARYNLGTRFGNHVETLIGTSVAFYGGSPNTGPDGDPAPAGTAWLYATGTVVVRRSEIFVNPDRLAAALNRSTNEVTVLAEREIVITRECGTAAVLININC